MADATDPNNPFERKIKNLNVYNFCNICYSLDSNSTIRLLTSPDFEQCGGTVPSATFTNCNFAGIFIGYIKSYYPIVGHHQINNPDYATTQLIFTNCTFNFHFKNPVNENSKIRLSTGNNKVPVKLTNCSISISGNVSKMGFEMCSDDLQYYHFALFDTVTVTNSQAKPLICRYLKFIMPQSEYNYYKLYAHAYDYTSGSTDDLIISDSLGLINKTRLTATKTGGVVCIGIVMQEDDTTAADYIYNEQNLETAGFLVGQVIT